MRHILNSRSTVKKILVFAMFAAPFAYSQKLPENGLSHADSSFFKDAADGGMDEVKLGQLATQNGASDRVKKFGQRMVDDHSKMGDELKALASRKGVTLPADIGVKDKASYHLLSSKAGEGFDKSYISSMIKDHEDDIAAFQKEANNGTDADVKAFAAKALPTLQEHLRMAQEIGQELGVSK
jgi:putative membrane protein